MTEHVLTMNAAKIAINKQPRCGDDVDHERMIKNKLRVYPRSPDSVALQIRGEKNYATVTLHLADIQWLMDSLRTEAAELSDAEWEQINQQQAHPVPAGAKAAS